MHVKIQTRSCQDKLLKLFYSMIRLFNLARTMPDTINQFTKENSNTHWTFSFLVSKAFVGFLDLIPEAAILSNEAGDIVLTNITAQTFFQYSKDEFLKHSIEDLVSEKIRAIHPKMHAYFFENPEPRFLNARDLELYACRKDGSEFPMESALFAIQTDKGPLAVNLLRDISEQKKFDQQISEYAFVDTLTNLPNRRYFNEILERDISKACRHQEKLGILFIDLDKFKPINDTHGHHIGDLVLKEISTRLTHILRVEDLLARIGGDEFIITVFPVSKPHYLDTVAMRILEACHKPMLIENKTLQLSASIGISINNARALDGQNLIDLADKAMYHAKRRGGNCFVHADSPKP
jgi:diguanylate cyclase (GGDEF)-like protein/PAS domain S-box-containing protein